MPHLSLAKLVILCNAYDKCFGCFTNDICILICFGSDGMAQKVLLNIAAAGAADRPVQEIKIKAAHVHANPLAGA